MKKSIYIFFTSFGILIIFMSLTWTKSSDNNHLVTASSIKRGEIIVMNFCSGCHGGEDGKLSGKYFLDIPSFFGLVHSANITQHKEKGIGNYTREQFRTLIRTRVMPNGKKVFALMPVFPLMADDDVESMYDFLTSNHPAVQASDASFKPQKLKMIARWFDKKMKVLPMPSKPIPMPDANNKLEVGKYLSVAVYRCFECHSPDMFPDEMNPEKSKKYLAGGKQMADNEKKKVKTSNITPDEATGIGKYSEDDFYKLIHTGIRKNGKSIRYPMLPLPLLSKEESDAIYTYLRTVKPIKNKVKEYK